MGINSEPFEGTECISLLETRCVHYLDLNLCLENGELLSDLYCKPTDCHQYLHFTSCHPYHTKKSIIYSQALRLKRLCSSANDFSKHLLNLKTWFSDRGYPETLVNEQCMRAKNKRIETRVDKQISVKNKQNIPLVVTYHPALSGLGKIIGKHFHILQADEDLKKAFPFKPFVSYRNAKSLRNRLVRAKVPDLISRKGTFKCNRKACKVCINLIETNEFTCSVTGKGYKINYELGCNSICLIYFIPCKICNKQLVGECTTTWRARWNNYKDNSRKSLRNVSHFQKDIHDHFLTAGHSGMIEDTNVILIDKTDRMFPKNREKFWMNELQTLSPLGLNTSETI